MRGKTVLVTGAGAGIGRAACLASAARGAGIVALDIDGAAADATAAKALTIGSPTAIGIPCDVSSEKAVREAFAVAATEVGLPDAVFANAGIEINGPLHEFDSDTWRRVMEVNLGGVFLTCREAVRRLVEAGRGGSIVCTASPAAFVGFAGGGNSAYAASKGGIAAFVRSIAIDYAARNIRVNTVVPGATDTAMLVDGLQPDARTAATERIRAAAAKQVPLGRLARPQEIAAAVVWLLSDESSYVTGSHLVCDGGLTAKSPNDF
nr:SDR family NAD(P)-dependent oxidoreductase [Kibdelosporangium sp. MJ126-NF4]CEL20826.1 3-oxoacyl-[acyl-carrier protein] reductase [Kibdelosporangium sp. MJ126-NF4]CTQ98369.1 3-oxoacyl-[acyl-carrier protein] reductase (EC 1.1.1.100) [Kibdelosporangium sp. MJ126-NF4]